MLVLLVSGILAPMQGSAAPSPAGDPVVDPTFLAFLRSYVEHQMSLEPAFVLYAAQAIQLSHAPEEGFVVYLDSPSLCGSGGCRTLIIDKSKTEYRVITQVNVSRRPVVAFESWTNGWRDLGVAVGGGGINPGYEALLPFDGHRYPGNPTVPPARQAKPDVPSIVLIGADTPLAPLHN
jgi:hypothetical protein